MWILTSLSRPRQLRRMMQSYEWTGEDVMLVLYSGDPEFLKYGWAAWPGYPDSWRMEMVDILGNGPTYNEIFRRYPDETFYGFLADDVLLNVPGMLRDLEAAAGRWNISYANDQHHEDRICTMPCIGGDLARAVGYLAPKNIMHMSIDCAWHEIGHKLGALRYFPHLTYTHLHPLWGTAEWDETYAQAQRNSVFHEQLLRSWMFGGEMEAAIERVKSATQHKMGVG